MTAANPFCDTRSRDEFGGFLFRVPYAPPTAFGGLLLIALGAIVMLGAISALLHYPSFVSGVLSIMAFGVGALLIVFEGWDVIRVARAERLKVTIVEARPDWDPESRPRDLTGHTILISALDRYDEHKPVELSWKLAEDYLLPMSPGREYKFYAREHNGTWNIVFAELGEMTARHEYFDYMHLRRYPRESKQLM